VIDWESSDTNILLNPRLPREDTERVRELIDRAPLLQAHVWLTTSGSADRIKPVALAKHALLASAAAVNRHLESDGNDVWVNALPTFHVGGLGIYARAFSSGAGVETCSEWSARAYHRLVTDAGATLSALVPTQVHDIVRATLTAPASLRAVVVGGGRLPDSLYRDARALGWPLLPSYGCTELGSQVATATLDSLDHDTVPPLTRLSHVEVRVDVGGLLALRGPSLFTAYATERGLDDGKHDGWWRSDDTGRADGDTLTVIGRIGDVFKIGGEIVSLAHLQSIADHARADLEIPGDAAAVAMPDERLGHTVQLLVAGMTDTDVTRLLDAFNGLVLPYERARSTRVVEAILRSPLGKILRSQLQGAQQRAEQ
jgi:O-succinylbenzoic acid--CoA ligase